MLLYVRRMKTNLTFLTLLWLTLLIAPFDAYILPHPFFIVFFTESKEYAPQLLITCILIYISYLIVLKNRFLFDNHFLHLIFAIQAFIVLEACASEGYRTRFLTSKNFSCLILFLPCYVSFFAGSAIKSYNANQKPNA